MMINFPLRPSNVPDRKVHGTNMGPTWGREDPGGPHVGPVNFAIWGIHVIGSVNECSRVIHFRRSNESDPITADMETHKVELISYLPTSNACLCRMYLLPFIGVNWWGNTSVNTVWHEILYTARWSSQHRLLIWTAMLMSCLKIFPCHQR